MRYRHASGHITMSRAEADLRAAQHNDLIAGPVRPADKSSCAQCKKDGYTFLRVRSGPDKGECKASTGNTHLQRLCPSAEYRRAKAAHQQRTAPPPPPLDFIQLDIFDL